MRKRILGIFLMFCMALTLLPVMSLPVLAEEGSLPSILIVEPSETDGIPSKIDVVAASYDDGSNTVACDLYLPGSAVVSQCFFSWPDGFPAVVDGEEYESGLCPVPAVGETRTYTFTAGSETRSFAVRTWQGSSAVKAIFIDIDESKGTIADMNSDPNHETSCSGIIFIDGEQYTLKKMKGRGNTTWSYTKDKKPYNLTLDEKVNLLGIDSGKTAKWSILSETADHSLMRTRTGFLPAHQLGIGLDAASADVWMNGEYKGCYTVTPKYDSFVSKDGYLVEQDNHEETLTVAEGGDPQFALIGLNGSVEWPNLITVKAIGDNLLTGNDGVVDESPENIQAVTDNIQAWMQDAWDAMRSENGINSKGRYYTDYIDMESFARMWLIQEYIKDFDICSGSKMFYRNGTSDEDKLYAGPLWDLDYAIGSTLPNGRLGSAGDRRSGKGMFIPKITEYKTSIYKTLWRLHPDFREEVYRQYNLNRSCFEDIPAELQVMKDELEASAVMNHYKVQSINYNVQNYTHIMTLEQGDPDYEQVMLDTTDDRTDWFNYAANLLTYVTARSKWFRNTYEREE